MQNSYSSVIRMMSVILDDDFKAVESVLMCKDQVFFNRQVACEGIEDVCVCGSNNVAHVFVFFMIGSDLSDCKNIISA